jgi:hypothetical protein
MKLKMGRFIIVILSNQELVTKALRPGQWTLLCQCTQGSLMCLIWGRETRSLLFPPHSTTISIHAIVRKAVSACFAFWEHSCHNTICPEAPMLTLHTVNGTIRFRTRANLQYKTPSTIPKPIRLHTSSLSHATISPYDTCRQKQYTGSFGSTGISLMATALK